MNPAARRVVGVLGAPLSSLLHSADAEVVADRLARLDPEGGSVADAEVLDRALAEVRQRRTVLETLARLAIIAMGLLIAAIAALLAASFAGEAFRRHVHVDALAWPPTARVVHLCLLCAALAWLLGWVVVWLRGIDRVHRSRRALEVASAVRPATWPGLAVDSPFDELGRRWTYPGGTLVLAGVALVVLAVVTSRWGHLLPLLVGLACCVVGVLLLRAARGDRRAHALAQQTLFIGVPG